MSGLDICLERADVVNSEDAQVPPGLEGAQITGVSRLRRTVIDRGSPPYAVRGPGT